MKKVFIFATTMFISMNLFAVNIDDLHEGDIVSFNKDTRCFVDKEGHQLSDTYKLFATKLTVKEGARAKIDKIVVYEDTITLSNEVDIIMVLENAPIKEDRIKIRKSGLIFGSGKESQFEMLEKVE